MNLKSLMLEPAVIALAASLIPAPSSARETTARLFAGVAVALSLTALLAFLGFGFMWLDRHYSREDATLIFSGATAGLAAVTAVIAYVLHRYRVLKLRLYQHAIINKIEGFVKEAADEIEGVAEKYPKTSVAVTAMAGYLTAKKAGEGTTHVLKMLDRML